MLIMGKMSNFTTTDVVDGQLGLSGVDDDDSDYNSVTKTYQKTCQRTVIGGYGPDFKPVLSTVGSALPLNPNAVALPLSVPSCLGAACLGFSALLGWTVIEGGWHVFDVF